MEARKQRCLLWWLGPSHIGYTVASSAGPALKRPRTSKEHLLTLSGYRVLGLDCQKAQGPMLHVKWHPAEVAAGGLTGEVLGLTGSRSHSHLEGWQPHRVR